MPSRELWALQQAFAAYQQLLAGWSCSSTDRSGPKAELGKLVGELQDQGLVGEPAITILLQCQPSLTAMDNATFSAYYRFVFLVICDPGRRNLQIERAERMWQHLLLGRFRLLHLWCLFICQNGAQVVTEDTWRQLLDFSRCVHEDLSNYDAAGAWPVLIDDFVQFVQSSRCRSPPRPIKADLAATHSALAAGMQCSPMAVSPCAGSKRRYANLDSVVCQLDQLKPMQASAVPSPKRLRMQRRCPSLPALA